MVFLVSSSGEGINHSVCVCVGLRLEHSQWIEHYFLYSGLQDSPRSPSPTGISSTSSFSEGAVRFSGVVRSRSRRLLGDRARASPTHNLGVFGSADFNCPSMYLDYDLQHLSFFRSNQAVFRAIR